MIRRNYVFVIMFCLGLLIWISGCRSTPDANPAVDATTTPASVSAATTDVVAPTPTNTPPLATSSQITLTMWVPISLIANDSVLARSGWQEQLRAFDESHPNVTIQLSYKSLAGQGGILSYLRTGRDVAPTILPDLIILPTTYLQQAINDKVIYNLNQLIGADLIEDLYPAATVFAQGDNNALMAYPFALTNLAHLATNKYITVSEEVATWTGFLNQEESLALPLNGPDGGRFLLNFYLAAGGELYDENGVLAINEEILTEALNQIRKGRNRNVIVSPSVAMRTYDESWRYFADGESVWVTTTVVQFLDERAHGFGGDFMAIPGPETALSPTADGWVWAVSTPDPDRQIATVELITWLAAEPNIGHWSWQMQLLPARRAAFSQWPTSDPYIQFVQNLLEIARPFPTAAEGLVMDAFITAVTDVANLTMTPPEAARHVVETINP